MDSERSSFPRKYKYDVFLSFRGSDTRNSFVDHLYAHLIRKGVFTFKDDKGLRKGEFISTQLVQAIKESRISIIVFSKLYASSSWCLDEMATIAECRQQFKQTVFAVFYDVDPSHVRNHNGVYENYFNLHADKFKHDRPGKVDQWKRAMRLLGNSSGWDVRDKPEFREIEKIVQGLIEALNHKFSGLVDDLIGIQPRVELLESLLKLNSEDDEFWGLGIWGMGGIGKTTHATVLYDKISYQFDACCFIENVSKIYRDGGVTAVQNQILCQALGEKNVENCSASEISRRVRNRLHNIKVLIVLDNVDQFDQLCQLAIKPHLLYPGSRMIITTRDKHILKLYRVNLVYEVPLLNDNDARELFYKKAFKSEEQSRGYVEFIPKILKYAQYLPLAIEVLGSFLCTRNAIEWEDALIRLGCNPDDNILDVLQISVDGLQHIEKEIFLHIACFFNGERENYVKRILHACGLHPHIGISVLIEKSLITIKNQEVHMHEMLQELGKKIVRQPSPEEPRSWNRLWLYKDFYHVLSTEKVANNIVKAIVLDPKEDVSKCTAEGLSKLKNLKLLILYHKNFSGTLSFLSNNLQYLLWHGYPFVSLPSNFEPLYLVELNMPDSCIKQLWEGRKDLPYLRRVDLNNSKYLTETPNFEGSPLLERLDLTGCTNLLQVHLSIGLLDKLVFLSLRNCSNLVNVNFSNVPDSSSFNRKSSFRVLHLSGCSRLENMPDLTRLPNLEYLDMDGCTSLFKVHESIVVLEKLRFLSLRDCANLVRIPYNINTMTSLITLDLCGCSNLAYLPLRWTSNFASRLESLTSLDLSFCNLSDVPNAIGELRWLERLNLQGNRFDSLPIMKLYSLAYLNLSHCHELQWLPNLPSESAASVGRYFKMASGSRDHRSGLYLFDCPKVFDKLLGVKFWHIPFQDYKLEWLVRLIKEPGHFRCGFDIIVPWNLKNLKLLKYHVIPLWFNHRFKGGSIVRIVHCDMDEKWIGFAFCVAFEVNDHPTIYNSPHELCSLPLPHPFYLSFESEYTEERFDMALNLELNKIDGSNYLWIIYISRQHCHFAETGACVTFKARPGIMVKKWGLRKINKHDREAKSWPLNLSSDVECIAIDHNEETYRSNSKCKIQLPYNWLVTKEDEVENSEAKEKEINLSNLSL